MRDFAVQVTHRPGEVARVANALAQRGVNLKAVVGLTVGSQGVIRFIADDVESARAALTQSNIRFEENEVLTVLLENKAGELAGVAGKLADAGVNLRALYVTGVEDDLVELAIVPDDAKKAKRILE